MSKLFKPLSKVMGAIGLIDQDDENETETTEEVNETDNEEYDVPSIANSKKGRVVSIKATSTPKVSIKKPEKFQDIMDIVDALKQRRIIVMNITEVEHNSAQRMIDYIGGACYALNAEFEEIEQSVYLVAPDNVEISNELKQELNKNTTFFPFGEK